MLTYAVLLLCLTSTILAKPQDVIRIRLEPMYSEDDMMGPPMEDYEPDDHPMMYDNMGFLTRLQQAMADMQRRMYDMRPDFGGPSFNFEDGPGLSNSTYNEEVINGTLVRVNQTVHTFNNSDSTVFVFHKVITFDPVDTVDTKRNDESEFAPRTETPVTRTSTPAIVSESAPSSTAAPVPVAVVDTQAPADTSSTGISTEQVSTGVPVEQQSTSTISNEIRP